MPKNLSTWFMNDPKNETNPKNLTFLFENNTSLSCCHKTTLSCCHKTKPETAFWGVGNLKFEIKRKHVLFNVSV